MFWKIDEEFIQLVASQASHKRRDLDDETACEDETQPVFHEPLRTALCRARGSD